MIDSNFQRIGVPHNAGVGRSFEEVARNVLAQQGVELTQEFTVKLGVAGIRKAKRFDLGSERPPVLLECKSHKWTTGGNIPSAKMTVWNEAMYYFFIAPSSFRKIMFVLRHLRYETTGETLAAYYLRTYNHLIPEGIELWEYDEQSLVATKLL